MPIAQYHRGLLERLPSQLNWAEQLIRELIPLRMVFLHLLPLPASDALAQKETEVVENSDKASTQLDIEEPTV